jgi:hypothetical protein
MNIKIELQAQEAADLAQYLTRLHFDDFLSHTDAHYPKDLRIEQAYRFRDAVVLVERALEDERGFRPR